jgi:hypothetical protein
VYGLGWGCEPNQERLGQAGACATIAALLAGPHQGDAEMGFYGFKALSTLAWKSVTNQVRGCASFGMDRSRLYWHRGGANVG